MRTYESKVIYICLSRGIECRYLQYMNCLALGQARKNKTLNWFNVTTILAGIEHINLGFTCVSFQTLRAKPGVLNALGVIQFSNPIIEYVGGADIPYFSCLQRVFAGHYSPGG